jgi:hypothetical protein
MTSNPFPHPVASDPRYTLFLVIATPDRLERVQRDLHLLKYIQIDEWSIPQPVPDSPDRLMIVLNRLTP